MKRKEEKKEGFWDTLSKKRMTQYIMLSVIGICFVLTYSKIYDAKPDMNGDNIHYYALGQALSEGKGFTNIMGFEETPHTHFPPGYPLFVAGIMKFFPHSVQAVKIANGVLLGCSILLLFFFLRRLSGNAVFGFVTCLLCSRHAEILRYATIMMSEMLFLFCSLGVLCLTLRIRVERLFTRQGVRDNVLLLVLLTGMNYIYFIRTMGTSVILAIIFYFGILTVRQAVVCWRKKGKEEKRGATRVLAKYAAVFLLSALSFAGTKTAWDVRNRNVGLVQSDYIGDFKKKPNGQVMSTWEDWKGRIQRNYHTYLKGWIPKAVLNTEYTLNTQGFTQGEAVRGYLIALMIIAGLCGLKCSGLLLFLYLGATMAVLLVWPEQYGGLRYFIAIIPLFIFLFLYGIQVSILTIARWTKIRINSSFLAFAISITVLLWVTPAYSKALIEKKEMAKYKTFNAKISGDAFMEFISAMQWCGKNLPDSARVICRKPELFYLFSKGRKSSGFAHYGSPESIYRQLVEKKATHVIIDHWFRHAYVTLYPLIAEHYPESFRFVGEFKTKGAKQIPPTRIYEFHPQ